MNVELIIVALISGIFMLLSLVMLQRGWERKLALSQETQYKIAKLKQPKMPTARRMPKGYRDQIFELITLLGDDKVQDILGLLTEKQEDISGDNKIIQNLLPIAQGFLEGMNKNKSEEQQVNQNLLYGH